MYFIVFYIALVGHLSMAVPLQNLVPEQPSDLAQFFNSRIVGGTVVPYGSNPSMVALALGNITKTFICGGSLVTRLLVLSAAHCIVPMANEQRTLLSSAHGRVGSDYWNKNGTVLQYVGYEIHPDHDPWLLKNDIGFLKLAASVDFNQEVQPIRLERGDVGPGVQAWVTGWGTLWFWGPGPDRLQFLEVETISYAQCKKLIDEIFSTIWGSSLPINDTLEICTFHSHGHGMCHGDSGSPLISKETGYQIGIVSWGFPCAIGGPDVYARIQPVSSFIDEVMFKHHS